MTGDIIFQLVLLATVVALFASDRVRPDAVALGLILVLMISGQLTAGQAVSGFGDPLVLMIAGLFVVGEGLSRTGVAHALGGMLVRHAGGSEVRMLVSLMGVVAVLSAFMSSTGAVAVFIPVTLTLARRTGTPVERLLMPLSIAALLGGMLTLIGTPPNLVVSAELQRAGQEPFGFFDFLPIGLAVLVACTLWIVVVGRRQLVNKATGHDAEVTDHIEPTIADLADRYGKLNSTRSFRVTETSPLVGHTPALLELGRAHEVTLIGVERQRRFVREGLIPEPETVLQTGDLLHFLGADDAIDRLVRNQQLEPAGRLRDHGDVMLQTLGIAEALVPPGSSLAGASVRESRLRSERGLTAVAIRRHDEVIDENIADVKLAVGDSMLVLGDWRAIGALGRNPRELLTLSLPREMADVAPARPRAPLAVAIVLAMLLVMTFNLLPAVAAVLLAALVMTSCRCVTPKQAYQSVNWPSLVLIAGMLPMATALEQSGAITLIVNAMVSTLGDAGPQAVMASLFVLTALFSQFISNTATAVLIAPIAAMAAAELGVSPRPLLMAVALAASAAFLTPVASPVNTLVMGPGGYRFADFVKVGLPLVLITMVAAVFLVPLVFPLY